MGHWLDGLLPLGDGDGGASITIEWGGAPMPQRDVLAFGSQFIVADDGTRTTIAIDASDFVAPTRSISTTAPLTGGGNLSADRTLSIDAAAFVAPTRSIGTMPPLQGGGNLAADRTISIDPASYVAPVRAIATTAPLLGGGNLSADRTLSIDPLAFAAQSRTITTVAPLAGGGDLSANRTITIDTSALAPVARLISTAAPLTGGGDLSADRMIGLDPLGYVAPGRSINTTAPLIGGGSLAADRTLAVSAATGAALGVVQLAGNLGGTATVPLATGLTADTYAFLTAAAVAKGTWTTTGLRIGDATAPAQKLEVAGTTIATGDFIANSGANGKARLAGLVGSTTTHGALYLGNVTPSASNHALSGNGTNVEINAGSGGAVSCKVNGTTKLNLTDSAGNVNSFGSFSQNTQLTGGQLWTVKSPAITADYSIVNGDLVIPVDTTAAVRTVTLPGVQSGRKIIVKRRTGTNNVVINGTGTVDGVAVSSIYLMTGTATPGAQPFVVLIGDGTGLGWLIVAFYSIQINLP